MYVVNHLAAPGDIKRIDLSPDSIKVVMHNGQDRYYRASTTLQVACSNCNKPMGSKDGHGVSGTSHSVCRKCWVELGYPGEYPGKDVEG